MNQGYSEAELVANRAAALVWGGSEEDRRAWAEEVARGFSPDGALRVLSEEAKLAQELAHAQGVLFIPAVQALSNEGQLQITRCLREREERPKLVVGLSVPRAKAVEQGLLRVDLDYALQLGRVDLDAPGLREAIRSRRAKAPKPRVDAARGAPPRRDPPKRKPAKPAKKKGGRR